MAPAERAGAQRFGRSENRDCRYSQQGREMHCPGIVSKQQIAIVQLIDQFLERRLPDAIQTLLTQPSCNFEADCGIASSAEENPLHRKSRRDFPRHVRETRPSLRRAILRAGTKAEFELIATTSNRMGRRKSRLHFCSDRARQFEVLVGLMNNPTGEGLPWSLIQQPATPMPG